MKSVSIILAFGLVALAQAQDQCAAVAAKVPSCAVSEEHAALQSSVD